LKATDMTFRIKHLHLPALALLSGLMLATTAHAANWNILLKRISNTQAELSWVYTAQFLSQNDSNFTVCWKLNGLNGDVCNGNTMNVNIDQNNNNYYVDTGRGYVNLNLTCDRPYKFRIKKTALIFDTIVTSFPCQ
jgi:hypothetical protein